MCVPRSSPEAPYSFPQFPRGPLQFPTFSKNLSKVLPQSLAVPRIFPEPPYILQKPHSPKVSSQFPHNVSESPYIPQQSLTVSQAVTRRTNIETLQRVWIRFLYSLSMCRVIREVSNDSLICKKFLLYEDR